MLQVEGPTGGLVEARVPGAGLDPPPAGLLIESYRKAYGGNTVVDDVSIEVEPGALYGLLGANGSGKSTIVHGVAGLVPPDGGTIEIAGQPHDTVEAKRSLGFAPDELPLPASLTGADFLDLCGRLQSGTDVPWRDLLVEIVGLDGHLDKFIGEFSHGMKKKLQLVAALAHRPAFLLLDEPLRGLDPEAAETFLALLDAHTRAGGAALIATHDLAFAESRCDRVGILWQGSLLVDGAPGDLVSAHGAARLNDVFLEVSGLKTRSAQTRARIDAAWPRVSR